MRPILGTYPVPGWAAFLSAVKSFGYTRGDHATFEGDRVTVSIAALNWQASSNNLGPLCNTTLNFAADTVYVFPHLAGNFTGVDVAPKFLVINNLDNDQKIVVVFDDAVIYPINPFQRLTLPVPAGSKRCQITATGAVPAAVVATFAVDDLSAA